MPTTIASGLDGEVVGSFVSGLSPGRECGNVGKDWVHQTTLRPAALASTVYLSDGDGIDIWKNHLARP